MLTELRLERAHTFGDRRIAYDIVVGLGPGFVNEEGALEPLNLLRPSEGDQKLTTTVRLAYQPDSVNPNQMGIFASLSTIPGD